MFRHRFRCMIKFKSRHQFTKKVVLRAYYVHEKKITNKNTKKKVVHKKNVIIGCKRKYTI